MLAGARHIGLGATTAVPASLYRVPGREPGSRYGRRGAAAASRRPVAVDLFSGAGGFSLGFEQAGFDVLASTEYDPIHCAVHAFNFPRTEIVCADIRTIGAEAIRSAVKCGWRRHRRSGRWDGELDVVVGGPPCQGFSTGGKRQFDDVRNQIVFSFARLIGELRPRYFVMENVPGMSSLAIGSEDDAPKLIDVLLEDFATHGYVVVPPKILNAAEFGVPQQRRRLILIGARADCELPDYPKAETMPRGRRPKVSTSKPGDRSYCPTVWDAIGDLPDLDRTAGLLYTDETTLGKRAIGRMHKTATSYARALLGLEADREDYSYARIWDNTVLTSSLRTTHAPAVAMRFAATPQGYPEPISRLVRLHPRGVSSTLRAGTHYERGSFNAPRPIHPVSHRVISVREAARLHSFPDWFRFHWTKWHGFREVGNAIPPRMGRAVGRELIRALGIAPKAPKIAIPLGDPDLISLANLQAAALFEADLERIPRHALRTRSSSVLQAVDN
jgi:DNA (cytosine-5)-methyltransferase 1